MKKFTRNCKIILIFIFITSLAVPSTDVFCASHNFPNLANYFLPWQLSESDAAQLAKWDLIVLDMEVQVKNPELLRKIRLLNPQITILAYITAQEIRTDAKGGASPMRQKLADGIKSEWYLADNAGEKYTFWPGTEMLNVSDNCPTVGGARWNDYLVNFVVQNILSSGYWDGVFYDNGWDGISWFAGSRVDLDRNGLTDINPDAHWQAGIKYIFDKTRELTANKYLVVFNGTSAVYANNTNGMLQENFPQFGWSKAMEIYAANQNGKILPRVGIINNNTRNNYQPTNYRQMRYGLASTLLENGYYAFDFGDQDHGQLWWYDEYDVNLGSPAGEAKSISGVPKYQEAVWRRDFDQGIVLVNATDKDQTIDLGGDFEKIDGKQDPRVNSGEITNKVTVSAKDGLIMLKTFETVRGVIFGNGYFLRFFDWLGARVRNGFFAYEDSFSGGSQLYNGDLDADGMDEKIVESGGELQIFNSAGARWFSDYLLGNNFKGEIRLAVGKLLSGEHDQILTASSKGGRVSLYNYHGGLLRDDFYPLGRTYRGGFTVAIGNVDGGSGEAVVGTGQGRAGEVLVFDSTLKKIKGRFFPYEKNFKGGILVAAGDVNGDSKDEIITLPLSGRKLMIRIFDGAGKKLKEFALSSVLGSQGYMIGVADINFDGKKEIVVENK